ncbi:MAG: FAD-dependent monooxygenase, partial [Hansschlegelia sp.]
MNAAPNDILDVAIAGGGPAGLTLALALKRELGPSLRVAVFDPALDRPANDARASMIAADGRRLLQRLDAWPEGATPVSALRITDSRLDDAIRPTFLDLAGQADGEPFAHMAPDADLRTTLRARAAEAGVSLIAEAIADHKAEPGMVRIALRSGAARKARLLVAADGARSPTRARAGVAVYAFDYDQTALVATIGHSEPHCGV